MFSLQNLLLKILVIDSDHGGVAFIYQVRSHEIAQSIQNKIPQYAEGVCDFLEFVDTYHEKGFVELLWDASSMKERQWIDSYLCEYVIDIRTLGEEMVEAITLYTVRGV